MKKIIAIILSGFSGAGKGSIMDSLLKEYPEYFRKSVSCTTRSLREKEIEGVDYYSITKEEFDKKIGEGFFFEYEGVYGDGVCYGTPMGEIEKAISKGKICILDVDVKGAMKIKEEHGNKVICFFITPLLTKDSEILETILRDRLIKRGTVNFEKRIERIPYEISQMDNFDKIIENKNGDSAQIAISTIFTFLEEKGTTVIKNPA